MELRRAGFDKTSTRPFRFIRPGNGIADYSWRIHAYYLAMQSVLDPGDEVLIRRSFVGDSFEYGDHAPRQCDPRARSPDNSFIPLFKSSEKALTSKNACDRVELSSQSNRGISDTRVFAKVAGFCRRA